MKCEEAAEFVSALCDGETIPRSAAEHIGECGACRARLAEYSEMGAELRRVASLETSSQEIDSREVSEASHAAEWQTIEQIKSSVGWKGWETMRIPRFVFALLVVAIVALGSSLIIVRARAHTQGTVLMLVTQGPDGTHRCALSLEDEKRNSCRILSLEHAYEFRIITSMDDRIELGIRAGRRAEIEGPTTDGASSRDIDKLLEKPYWFRPGEKLEVPMSASEALVITGELLDHMPSLIAGDPSEQVDPKPGELRFVSPVLLRGKEVVLDLEGATTIAPDNNYEVYFYAPGEGLFHISLLPEKGAVEGHITMSRVHFEVDGESYTFLLGAPAARGEQIWVRRNATYKPSNPGGQRGFLGSVERDQPLD